MNKFFVIGAFLVFLFSSKKVMTSPNRCIIGLIGPGIICTRSISSEYLAAGTKNNLYRAVPPRKARRLFKNYVIAYR